MIVKKSFKYIAARLIAPITKLVVCTIRTGLAKGFKTQGLLGLFQTFLPLTLEDRFLQSLNLTDKTVYDVGAHIGITTMFFSKAIGNGGEVVSFEPNLDTFLILRNNIRLNQLRNVTALNTGLGERKESRTIVFDPFFPATGSMIESVQKGAMKGFPVTKTTIIRIDTLDNCFRLMGLPRPDFVKIDVEGMEYFVLKGMVEIIGEFSPSLFIEIHGANLTMKLSNVQRVVQFLESYDYSLYHVESKNVISTHNYEIAVSGHLYCKRSNDSG